MFSSKLRHRWTMLDAERQAELSKRIMLTRSEVERLLSNERVFMTTPHVDRRILAMALGTKETEHVLVRTSEETEPAAPPSLEQAEVDAEQLIGELCPRPDPPIDVERLAAAMGAEVVVESMRSDGRLERRDGRTIVMVDAKAPAARRRFTIAHELGHMWLHEHGRGGDMSAQDEERFCDRFAAALLMPRGWIEDNAAGREQNLRSLALLALQARTSKAAMLLRLHGLRGWRASLARFRWDEGAWRLQATTAAPARLRGHVTSGAGTERVLQIASLARRTVVLPLPLSTGDAVDESYRAEIQAGRHTAIALVNFFEPCGRASAYCPNDGCWVELRGAREVLLDDRAPAIEGGCPHCGTRLVKPIPPEA